MKRWNLVLSLLTASVFLFAMSATARPPKKNMNNSRLAEIEITSPLDAKTIEDAGGIFDHYRGPKPHVYLLPEDFENCAHADSTCSWLPEERVESGRP